MINDEDYIYVDDTAKTPLIEIWDLFVNKGLVDSGDGEGETSFNVNSA